MNHPGGSEPANITLAEYQDPLQRTIAATTMYTSFFGLNEKPFSITPDPRYLFMSERHGEALAHLVYGVTESGGYLGRPDPDRPE